MSTADVHDAEEGVTVHRVRSTSRASLLDPVLQQLLGPLSDAARRGVESVVVAGFAGGLLDRDAALDFARGLQWVRSGRAPALSVEAMVHELSGISWSKVELRRVSRAAASGFERGTPPGRRPAGSVRCPDARCCHSCAAAQQLVDAGNRIAHALIVIDTLKRRGIFRAAQLVSTVGEDAGAEDAGAEGAAIEDPAVRDTTPVPSPISSACPPQRSRHRSDPDTAR